MPYLKPAPSEVIITIWRNAATKSLQSCPTLCDPIDGSPPGSPVPGIFQARTLEWVVMSFSNAWKWKVKVKSLSCVQPSVTPWTAAFQAPPSMGFSRQEYWSGVPLPSPLKKWVNKSLFYVENQQNNCCKDGKRFLSPLQDSNFPRVRAARTRARKIKNNQNK